MSPTEELLVAAAVFYVLECVALLPRWVLLAQSWWPGRFLIRLVENAPGTWTSAMAFLAPLPPLGTSFVLDFWPMAVSPDGLSGGRVQRLGAPAVRHGALSGGFVRFEDVESIEVLGPVLRINGADFATCASETAAVRWRDFLEDVAHAPQAERAKRIQAAIDDGLDVQRTRESIASIRSTLFPVRLACNMLFVYVLVYCPIVIWQQGLSATWKMLLVALVPLWMLCVWMFYGAHRSLYPGEVGERVKRTLIIGVTPLSAIRAGDVLSRHALANDHPLAVSAVLQDDTTHRRLAAQVYADLLHPTQVDTEPDAHEVEAWLRDRIFEATQRCLATAGIEPADLALPPQPEHISSQTYCPRCQTQCEQAEGDCPLCPGVPLVAFDA